MILDNLTETEISFLDLLYPNRNRVEYKRVQSQPNLIDCGIFAIAFTVSIALGRDPSKENYVHSSMRQHVALILECKSLSLFPAVENVSTIDARTPVRR